MVYDLGPRTLQSGVVLALLGDSQTSLGLSDELVHRFLAQLLAQVEAEEYPVACVPSSEISSFYRSVDEAPFGAAKLKARIEAMNCAIVDVITVSHNGELRNLLLDHDSGQPIGVLAQLR